MDHQHHSARYTCPMHPQVMQDAPGTCPFCGMTLVAAIHKENKTATPHPQHGANVSMGHSSHNHHAMMIADFRKRFYVVLILTIPIMLLSDMIQHWLGVHWQFPGSTYLLFAFSSIVFFTADGRF